MGTEKTNQGRSDEAQDPARTGGVGRRDEPPGKVPETDEPRPDQTLPDTEPRPDQSLPETPGA